jgi:hypothetical protein
LCPGVHASLRLRETVAACHAELAVLTRGAADARYREGRLPHTHLHEDAVTATPQARRRGRGALRPSARARRRDVRRARGPVHGRARDADDAQHLPLCGRQCEERHARCASLE